MTWRIVGRIALKAVILFVGCNLVFALTNGMALVESISVYGVIAPGRARLPYSDTPQQAYSLSPDSIEVMLRSHVISRAGNPSDSFDVLLIGDSSVWGWRLPVDATLSAQLTARGLTTPDGRRIIVHNLAYPIQAALKDLILLDAALRAISPDAVIWLVTLDGLPYDKQTYPPLVARNADRARDLIARYDLAIDPADPAFVAVPEDVLARSIVGMRRPLADWARLQLFAIPWGLTRVDQAIPTAYTPVMRDLPADAVWNGIATPRPLTADDLALDVLAAGVARAAESGARMAIVNEPIYTSTGANADERYNSWYPRWAYDSYRALLAETCAARGWRCADLWEALPAGEFTDSPVHLSPDGTRLLSDALLPIIEELSR